MTYQGKITGKTILNEARKHGYQGPSRSADMDFDAIDEDGSEGVPPEFSDEVLTRQFVKEHAHRLRYTNKWGVWHCFDGRVWLEDTTRRVHSDVRGFCGNAADKAGQSNSGRGCAMRVASSRTIDAIERLARSDRALAATPTLWDADPWLLNTPDGVIDLRTGGLRAHKAGDYMSRITAVSPTGDCPLWLGFLKRITEGDADVQAYLQRVAGYCLTGDTREQALFFGYGSGGNGKGVFINMIAWILGSYATTAAMDTFTAAKHDRHPTELAKLDGPRLAVTTETEQGRRWAEAKIKTLTGGDVISARKMNKDFYDFTPRAKLFFTGNHRPEIANVDAAMKRRMHLIPFIVQIPAADQDKQLSEKLKAEGPGILQWMIEGCLGWQKQGLAPPDAVTNATSEYLSAEDVIGQWLAAECETANDFRCSTADLFQSFCDWSKTAGEPGRKQKWLTQQLKTRGFTESQMPKTRCSGLQGLRLRKEADSNPQGSSDF